jgi:2,3-bisphosphoglycerate-dependent phosphoglycerate mutase
MPRPKLIMIRHGESEWNRLNLFTGWVDIPLSIKGIEESIEVGKRIADLPVDVIFMSSLIRSQETAMLVMSQHKGGKVPCVLHPHQGHLETWANIYNEVAEKSCIPVITAWQLNERMYGQLQGKNKQEMREEFGNEQIKTWRRSFDVAPPAGESLAMTAERTLPYFHEEIVPYLKKGKNVVVSAHGNSLRAIVMELDKLTKEQVIQLEIPTGQALIYEYDRGNWIKIGAE